MKKPLWAIGAFAAICCGTGLVAWKALHETPKAPFGAIAVAKWKDNREAALTFTFDDNGDKQFGRIFEAALLEEHGFRGTFNVITGSWPIPEFQSIFRRGHELASHTVNHVRLSTATLAMITFELTESKKDIEQVTGFPCVTLCYPGGDLSPDAQKIASGLYLSARSARPGINDGDAAELYRLTVSPSPQYAPTTPKEFWTDERYCGTLRQCIEKALASGGWVIEEFHNMDCYTTSGLNSGALVTQSAMQAHLGEIASSYASRLWIAPQGKIARYIVEREAATLMLHSWTVHSVEFTLDLKKHDSALDEPLTVLVSAPEAWRNGQVNAAQGRKSLPCRIETENQGIRIVLDVDPGGGAIRLALAPQASWFRGLLQAGLFGKSKASP